MNLTDDPLHVTFSSTLGSQLCLQWSNANIVNSVPLARDRVAQIFNTIGEVFAAPLTLQLYLY